MCTPVKGHAFGAYSAIMGIIYPLQYSCITNNVSIIPFVLACDEHKKQVEQEITTFWKDDIEPSKLENYIESNWLMPDVFYIMTDFWNQEWIGCVGVDTQCGIPFITHVLIREKYRKLGLSKYLIMIAEEYVKTLGYKEARLCCKPDMKAFYMRRGYVEDTVYKTANGLHVMCRNVGDTRSDTCQTHQ
jgi:GNAT superfamily N-acetyltransferase